MTLFVAGAHGVGKTYLAKPAAAKLGLLHASASQLIRSELGRGNWDNERRVVGIDENQVALVRAVERHRQLGDRLLVDGHFVLRGLGGVLEAVSGSVFRDMGIAAVLLVEADVPVVLNRLQARDDLSWSAEEVTALIGEEARCATEICTHLNIPLQTLRNPTFSEFDAALSHLADTSPWP